MGGMAPWVKPSVWDASMRTELRFRAPIQPGGHCCPSYFQQLEVEKGNLQREPVPSSYPVLESILTFLLHPGD